MPEFIVTDPAGKEFVITAPDGATQEQALEYAKSQFGSTPGGAAVGNPNVQRGGEQARRTTSGGGEAIAKIGGAGAAGFGLGLVAPELLTGAAGLAMSIPGGQTLAPFLLSAGNAIRGQRLASGIAGAVSGVAGESAGQGVEAAGGPWWAAEGARLLGGGLTPEVLKAIPVGLYKATGAIPAVADIMTGIRKYIGKDVNLSAEQQKYLDKQIALLRGESTESDLTGTGNRMGDRAATGLATAGDTQAGAGMMRDAVGRPTQAAVRELSDIGDELRGVITKRNETLLNERRADYQETQRLRDQFVQAKEAANQPINKTPGFYALVDSLKADLVNGVRSPDVQAGIRKILSQLENAEKDTFGQSKPISFQALDDVRRQLGEVFRGKPAEGYGAIGEKLAKDLYVKISKIQEDYVGPAQRKLLDDYAARTEGLEIFRSKAGQRATALDKYDDTQFAQDAANLPKTYFKTRDSFRALKQLVGDTGTVNRAAAEFANRELKDATGPEVRSWMTKHSDWLQEAPTVRKSLDEYATRLEAAESSMRNAESFAKQAAANADLLTKSRFPARRAEDLIRSGREDLWELAAPAIANSPQAKQEVMGAARSVLAEQATQPGVIKFYERNLRPALERLNITNKAELDYIAERLASIKEMKVPEPEKLGIAKRIVLQAMAGMSASVASRGGVNAVQWSRDMLVPQ